MNPHQHLTDWANSQASKTTGFNADKAVEATSTFYEATDLVPPLNFFVGTLEACRAEALSIGPRHQVEAVLAKLTGDRNRLLENWAVAKAIVQADSRKPTKNLDVLEAYLLHTYYTANFREACFITTYPSAAPTRDGKYHPEWAPSGPGEWVRGSREAAIAQSSVLTHQRKNHGLLPS